MLFVDAAHESGCWRQNLVDEDVDGLLGGQLDPLSDDVDELPDCEVCGNQVLLLIDGFDVRLLDLFADDLYSTAVSILAPSSTAPGIM